MKKAQATLEFSLILIIAIALIAGFLAIARWATQRIEPRQAQYEADRLSAGTKATAGQPEIGYYNPQYDDDIAPYFRQ